MSPNKFVRSCPLFLPLLLSLSAFQSAFAQGAPALQLSTRVYLEPNTEAIAGFILIGTAGQKTVVVRGMNSYGSTVLPAPRLADPMLTLNGAGSGFPVTNFNFTDPPANIPPAYQPINPMESAINQNLSAGLYTAILKGTFPADFGLALVEVYDDTPATLKLANISTRAFVGTADKVVIAGFILVGGSGGSETIVVRGMGPSLAAFGVPNVLENPVLDLCCNAMGGSLLPNDNWQDEPSQAAQIAAIGLAPPHALEAALIITLPAGLYTATLSGLGNTIGNGLVEIYDLGPP